MEDIAEGDGAAQDDANSSDAGSEFSERSNQSVVDENDKCKM